TAVHEVTDTAGKTEKQVYRVLNDVTTGNGFIVISSENAEVNGMVYLIKGGTLYAAAPNQRSFVRLGSLNLDRRISGSLFSHWDLQGNIPIGDEYRSTLLEHTPENIRIQFDAKEHSHYQKVIAEIDPKTGLYRRYEIYDAKGLAKISTFTRPARVGKRIKRRVPTVFEMIRAPGRNDIPVPKTRMHPTEIEFNPEIDYNEIMAVSDLNLQRLR